MLEAAIVMLVIALTAGALGLWVSRCWRLLRSLELH